MADAEISTPAPVAVGTIDDLPDTSLFWRWVGRAVRPYAGWVIVLVGALAIFVGYLGVSNQVLVAKQLPYIISGGIFGLALVALGTYYLVTEELRRDSGRLDRVERLVLELHAMLLARPDAPSETDLASAVRRLETHGFEPRGAEAGSAGAGQANGSAVRTFDEDEVELVMLPDSQRFHRASCRMVAGKANAVEVTPGMIRRQQLQPCGMCDPVPHVGV
jgi:hypothetical protein